MFSYAATLALNDALQAAMLLHESKLFPNLPAAPLMRYLPSGLIFVPSQRNKHRSLGNDTGAV